MFRRLGGLGASVVLLIGVVGGPAVARAQSGTVPLGPSPAPATMPIAPPVAPRVITPPPPADPGVAVEHAIEQFRAAYLRRNAPRIAVYWNREVTDRISQWEAERRSLSTKTEQQRTDGSKPAARTASDAVTTEQRAGRDPAGARLGEGREWEFQDGLLDPLLQAGARLVDRAMINRLIAAQAPADDVRPLDVQNVEIKALQAYADVWVEVLVGNGSGESLEVRAIAKEVRTGTILASVRGRSAEATPAGPTQYVATSRGFEPAPPPPASVRQGATNLSLRLMDALARQWSR